MPVVPPVVESNAARLRFFVTSTHTEAQIRFAVAAVAEELARFSQP
jgi:7-keto-8-aminopelargonate synthetase-like enzyme